MRMTNEEFQAEVFRRSRVYLDEKKSSRKRLFAGIAACAACFVIAGGALMLRTSHTNDLAADMTQALTASEANCAGEAPSEESCDDVYYDECGEESCEECGEESCEECSEESSAESSEESSAESSEAAEQDISENADNTIKEADAAANPDDGNVLTADEFFSELGINPMPETLGGYTLRWQPEAGFDIRGRYAFLYQDQNGKNALIVYLAKAEDGETEEFDSSSFTDFIVNQAHVTISRELLQECDEDTFHELTEELKAYLPLE